MGILSKINFIVEPASIATHQQIVDKALAQINELQINPDNVDGVSYKVFYLGYIYDTRTEARTYVMSDKTVIEYGLSTNVFGENDIIANSEVQAIASEDGAATTETLPTSTVEKQFPDLGYEYITSIPDNIVQVVNSINWTNTLDNGKTYRQVQLQIVSNVNAEDIDNNLLSVSFYNDPKKFYPVKTSMTETGTIVDFIPIGLKGETLTFNITKPTTNTIDETFVKIWTRDIETGIITIESITPDNIIDLDEQVNLPEIPVTGTAVGGVVADGDTVELSVNGNTYTTTVSNGIWSVDVIQADLINDLSVTANVTSTNDEGFEIFSNSDEHTHTFIKPPITFDNVTKITRAGALLNDYFGHDVAISDKYFVVNAMSADLSGDTNRGEARVYNCETGLLKRTLKYGNATNDQYAWSVDTAGDYVVTGEWKDDTKGTDAGAAWFFNITSGQGFKKTASDGDDVDQYGFASAVSTTKFAAGAYYETSQTGAVYLYNIDGNGENKVVGPDCVQDDAFGKYIALTDTHLIAAAPGHETNGAVFVHTISGAFVTKISPPEAGISNFGFAVSANSNNIIIGCSGANGGGAIFIYDFDGVLVRKITPSDLTSTDGFGNAVDISEEKIIVGTSGTDKVYIFNIDGTEEKILTVVGENYASTRFGYSVGISEMGAVVGAMFSTNEVTKDGAAYFFN